MAPEIVESADKDTWYTTPEWAEPISIGFPGVYIAYFKVKGPFGESADLNVRWSVFIDHDEIMGENLFEGDVQTLNLEAQETGFLKVGPIVVPEAEYQGAGRIGYTLVTAGSTSVEVSYVLVQVA